MSKNGHYAANQKAHKGGLLTFLAQRGGLCRRLGAMTAKQYTRLREGIASQNKVSIMLGVDIRTVQRREAGFIPVTKEAERAIRSLAAEERARQLIKAEIDSNEIRSSLEQIAEMLAVKP